MRKRAVFILAAMASTALQVAPATTASGARSVHYTFEQCAQGWKVKSQSAQPTPTSKWHRASPGDSSTMAFYNGPPYAGSDAHEYLTSPAHRWRGGRITLKYAVNYNYEPEATRAVEEGIHVEWSRNGRSWKRLAFHGETNVGYPAFEHHTKKFKAPRGKVFIRFHVMSDALVESNGGAVDNVILNTRAPRAGKC